jgi:hypothetical protein
MIRNYRDNEEQTEKKSSSLSSPVVLIRSSIELMAWIGSKLFS